MSCLSEGIPFNESRQRRRSDIDIYDPNTENDSYKYHGQSKSSQKKQQKKKKPYRGLRITAIILSIILFCEATYCFLVFTNIPTIKYWRDQFISTALSTMSHSWLAEWFLPEYMVEDIRMRMYLSNLHQEDEVSQRPTPTQPTEQDPDIPTEEATEPTTQPIVTVPGEDPAETAFYELFWELNRSTFESYVKKHPDVLKNGWENVYINEAGFDDKGTSIYTAMGE